MTLTFFRENINCVTGLHTDLRMSRNSSWHGRSKNLRKVAPVQASPNKIEAGNMLSAMACVHFDMIVTNNNNKEKNQAFAELCINHKLTKAASPHAIITVRPS